jgi:tetratricopeptide (TPR) repeat protein
MRTFSLTKVVPGALVIGSLFVAVSPLRAEESASSVNFVNRDALSATSTNGWRNPLRAGSAAAGESAPANSLRENVTPVSYEEEVADSRGGNGLKLRPHKEPTGIFSSMMGEGSKAFSKPKTPTSNMGQPQFRQAAMPPTASKSATQKALGMIPQFKSSSARQNVQMVTTAPAETSSRVGSAPERTAYLPSQRPTARTANQATYNSAAAAAQNYRPNSLPQTTATARRPQPAVPPTKPIPPKRQVWNSNPNLGRPTIQSQHPTAAAPTQAAAAPATGPTNGPMLDPSSPAGILMQAHRLTSTARTEEDFAKIVSLCQQVPARTATGEEAAFGRQLAAWALNRRGQLRAKTNNAEAAMDDFSQAIRIDAKCWRALHNRGVLLAQSGQFEPAFDDFHQTIELNPGYAKAYANRGALYVLAGELEPALADYQQAATLDPDFAIAERGCGRTCHMLGRIDEAYGHLTRAIELAPRDATAIASRGDLLVDMGEYETAAADYDQAIAIQPSFADAHRGSAWLLATCPDENVRNPELALERAQKAVELERKADATTFDTLAAAQASVGDFQNAAATIRRAIEIAPPSERSVYQDRMQLYRSSRPFVIEPVGSVQQAAYER